MGWGMRTPFPSHCLPLSGDGGRALPLHGLPFTHHPLQGKGCEHDPTRRRTCTTLARPTIRKPPCKRHPACGTARAWHPNGGACKGRARTTARGVVLTRNGGGALLPFGAPHFACRPQVGRWAGERVKGGGAFPWAFAREGTCEAALIFAATPVFPRSRASFVCYARVRERDARCGGRRILSRLSGGEGRSGGWCVPLGVALHPPFAHRGGRVRSPLFREASHW